MENVKKKIYLCSTFLFLFSSLFAQVNNTTTYKIRKNVIGLYFGMIEYNINYERNIIQRENSHTNLRIGFGYLTDLQIEYRPINATIVQMFGKKNNHLELNLGLKYLFGKTEGEKDLFLPEIYAGYRYEKPDGKSIFRFGLSFPSLLNIGFGIKL